VLVVLPGRLPEGLALIQQSQGGFEQYQFHPRLPRLADLSLRDRFQHPDRLDAETLFEKALDQTGDRHVPRGVAVGD
jgi:hypothetical protein